MKVLTIDQYQSERVGKTQSYADYRALAKSQKAVAVSEDDFVKTMEGDDEEEEDEDEEDEDEEGDGDVEKSSVTANDLLKSIQDYEAVEAGVALGGGSREATLTEKMRNGTITKSEQSELGEIWTKGAGNGNGAPLVKSLGDRMRDEDPNAAGLVDASDFLKSLIDQSDASLRDVASAVERDGLVTRNLLKGQGSLIKSIGAVIAGQQELIKSQQRVMDEMGRRLGIVEGQPVVRKSVGADPRDVRPARGSGGGRGSDPGQLTKSQVQQGLRRLTERAAAAGDDGAIDKLTHATARFEGDGHVAPSIAGAIRHELGLTQ